MDKILSLVKKMHEKFGIANKSPADLTLDEKLFRAMCMREEVTEFLESKKLTDQLDAVIDLIVFASGTINRLGLTHVADEAYYRVMQSNLSKKLGPNKKKSRPSFEIDLQKPPDWKAADLNPLMELPTDLHDRKGLIVIDGPDASGKSTLAEQIKRLCSAHIFHLTWNELVDTFMDDYQLGTLTYACQAAKEKVVVIDRLYLSEIIYAGVYRDGSRYDPSLPFACTEMLREANAIQIIALPPFQVWKDVYIETQKSKGQLYEYDPDAEQVYFAYARAFYGPHFKEATSIDLKSDWFKENAGLMSDKRTYLYNFHSEDILKYAYFILKQLGE